LIKYIKSVLWRVAKCLSYIEEARCLKVNETHRRWLYHVQISSTKFRPHRPKMSQVWTGTAARSWRSLLKHSHSLNKVYGRLFWGIPSNAMRKV